MSVVLERRLGAGSRSPHRRAVLMVLTLGLASCGGSFRPAGSSVTNPTLPPPPVEFGLGDGSQGGQITEGDVLNLAVSADPGRFSRIVDAALLPDPDRFIMTLSADLGDPQNGGVAAGENLVPFLRDAGFAVADPPGDRVEVKFEIDTDEPLLFPAGFLIFSLTLLANDDTPDASSITVELLAANRPTLAFSCERPSDTTTPTGKPLPISPQGSFMVGHTLPFTIILRATPNPETDAGFRFRRNGEGNPDAISWVADQDLGDPDNGGFEAGENLATLVTTNVKIVIDDQGVVTTGFRFDLGSPLLPTAGVITFRGFVTDQSGMSSLEQTLRLEVRDLVTLRVDVLPIVSPLCTQCHGPTFRIYQDLDLSLSGIPVTAVGVRAGETPDDSCARQRLEPYEIDSSYLIHKLEDTFLGGCVNGSGQRMPAGFPPLEDSDVQVIREWVLQGCFDN